MNIRMCFSYLKSTIARSPLLYCSLYIYIPIVCDLQSQAAQTCVCQRHGQNRVDLYS